MPATPAGVSFTIPQLVSFLAWSEEGAARHGLLAVVRWDYGQFEEVIEVSRRGDSHPRPRWLIHRAPDGAMHVTRNGVDHWTTPAASAEEAQVVIEMEEASRRRAGAKRAG